MTNFQMNRIVGILYVVLGGALFLYVSWEFLIRAMIALVGLYAVAYGFKLQGYPFSRFLFMVQHWRSRF